MWQRVLALAQKEFIQIRRDPRTLGMMIVLPIIWLVLFGYAFSFDVKEIKVAVVDNSGTTTGATVADSFRSYERFVVTDLPDQSEAGIREAMYRDQVQMGIIIPPGFAEAGNESQMQVLVDGADMFAAQTAARLLPSALEPVQAKLKADMAEKAKAALASLPPQAPKVAMPSVPQLIPALTVLYNPDLKTANVMIPGLLGLVVMFMTTLMTALGVVKEREYGTMEQLVVTPIRPLELMLGKLLPYFLVGAVDFALVFVAGQYLFDLTFAGSLPIFLLLSLLLVATTLGLGLLISTVAQTQQQAMQIAIFTMFPQILMSGLIFPISSMPKVIQVIAYLLPFTHYVPIARGMFIKGQGLDLLWPQALVLAGYAIVVVSLATLRFRKRIA
jgi:ABC-2 type transport system permease protein